MQPKKPGWYCAIVIKDVIARHSWNMTRVFFFDRATMSDLDCWGGEFEDHFLASPGTFKNNYFLDWNFDKKIFDLQLFFMSKTSDKICKSTFQDNMSVTKCVGNFFTWL